MEAPLAVDLNVMRRRGDTMRAVSDLLKMKTAAGRWPLLPPSTDPAILCGSRARSCYVADKIHNRVPRAGFRFVQRGKYM